MPEAAIDSACRVRIDVGLSAPALYVASLRGVDRMSDLFRYEIDVMADGGAGTDSDTLDLEALVGKPCHITFQSAFLDDLLGDVHSIHGFVTRIVQGDHEERFTNYRITVMPRVSKLTHRSACRIFQELDAKSIAETILKEHGFSSGTDFDFRLSEAPIPRPYCVQYRETDWDFLTRIMQEDGIFSFFVHDGEKEMIVYGSEYPVHPNLPGAAKVPFRARADAMTGIEAVNAISVGESLVSGAVKLREWNFEEPDLTGSSPLESEKDSTSGSPVALEIYDYPGQFSIAAPDGKTRANVRMEQVQGGKRVANGEANSPRFAAGHIFELSGHYRSDLDAKYVLVEVYHRIAAAGDAGHEDTVFGYHCEFVAQPREVQFRALPRGPKPRIPGVQTALVVGPKGEEIHTDDRGRVLLKFHWDRAPDREKPTAWVRVAQLWGSTDWGAFFLPRIDQEVIVAFEDGDPDRPLVVGTVSVSYTHLTLPTNREV